MAEKITDKMIEQLEQLSMLALAKEEKMQMKQDMGHMLEYFDQLDELDLEETDPLFCIFSSPNVFRDDVIKECEHALGYRYQVPKLIE